MAIFNSYVKLPEGMQNHEVEIASLFPSPKNSCEKKTRPVEVIVGGGIHRIHAGLLLANKAGNLKSRRFVCMNKGGTSSTKN